jgi:hypothetical protein
MDQSFGFESRLWPLPFVLCLSHGLSSSEVHAGLYQAVHTFLVRGHHQKTPSQSPIRSRPKSDLDWSLKINYFYFSRPPFATKPPCLTCLGSGAWWIGSSRSAPPSPAPSRGRIIPGFPAFEDLTVFSNGATLDLAQYGQWRRRKRENRLEIGGWAFCDPSWLLVRDLRHLGSHARVGVSELQVALWKSRK